VYGKYLSINVGFTIFKVVKHQTRKALLSIASNYNIFLLPINGKIILKKPGNIYAVM